MQTKPLKTSSTPLLIKTEARYRASLLYEVPTARGRIVVEAIGRGQYRVPFGFLLARVLLLHLRSVNELGQQLRTRHQSLSRLRGVLGPLGKATPKDLQKLRSQA